MNEKEVKERAQERALCSVTGRSCRCGDSGRCESRLSEPRLDEPTTEVVRELRTARIYIEAAKYRLDDIVGGEHLLQRRHPMPEVREVRRKLTTAIALIDEIGGEL